MKKIIYSFTIAMILLMCSEQKAAAQVAPGITILAADDSTWNQGCSVPDTINMFVYGTAGGYLITDSVTIYFAYGDGTDTIDGDLTQQLLQWESMRLQCYIANKWKVQ